MSENQTPVPENRQSDKQKPSIIQNHDGTYTRLMKFPTVPATPNPTATTTATSSTTTPVLSKDIPLNSENQTWLRIFLPQLKTTDTSSTTTEKLPVVVYFHGGGFVFMSAASAMIHNFCAKLAAELTAIVVSVEYRLAPEHRLPAAYEDAVETLHTLKKTPDVWLTDYADLSNCFLMGSSAGANIAYHVGARANGEDLGDLKIKGLILHHPFFGGSGRTESEVMLSEATFLTLNGTDVLWGLALPVGSDRDHEYCNPTGSKHSEHCGRIRESGFRVLVTACYGDLLIDRQMEFVKMLEKEGVRIMTHFGDGYHSVEIFEPVKAEALFPVLKKFVGLV